MAATRTELKVWSFYPKQNQKKAVAPCEQASVKLTAAMSTAREGADDSGQEVRRRRKRHTEVMTVPVMMSIAAEEFEHKERKVAGEERKTDLLWAQEWFKLTVCAGQTKAVAARVALPFTDSDCAAAACARGRAALAPLSLFEAVVSSPAKNDIARSSA